MERKTKSFTDIGSKIKGRRPLHSVDTEGSSPYLHDIERRLSPNTRRRNIGEISSQESLDDQEDVSRNAGGGPLIHSDDTVGSLSYLRDRAGSPITYGWNVDRTSSHESLNDEEIESENDDSNKDDASKIKNSSNKCIPDNSQPLCDYEPESIQQTMMPQSAPHSAGLVKTFTSNIYKIPIVMVLVVSLVLGYSVNQNRGYSRSFDYDDSISKIPHGHINYRELSLKETLLKKNLLKIQKTFPSQRISTWPDLFGGIKNVLNEPHSPSVFVLLHNGENDRRTVQCLSYKVARAASRYLTAKQNNFPVLDGRNLTTVLKNKDIGKFVDFLREYVNRTQVVVVNHLEAVDGKIAQSFHHFCDEVVPFVKEAVYFFTLTIPPTQGIRPVKAAEDRLNSLWRNQIDPDTLKALVIRLTSSVISVLPEPDDYDCFIDERHKLGFNSFSDRRSSVSRNSLRSSVSRNSFYEFYCDNAKCKKTI